MVQCFYKFQLLTNRHYKRKISRMIYTPVASDHKKNNKTRTIIPVLTSFSVGLFLLWILLSQGFSGAYWSRWYPLLIPQDQVDITLVERLFEESDQLVYGNNRNYSYNNFSGTARISGSELEMREELMDNDPRLDPFLRKANRYFKDDLYEFFYLPADRSSLKYKNALKDVWQDDWILPDCSWDLSVLILAAVLAASLLIRAGRQVAPVLLLIAFIAGNIYLGHFRLLMPGVLILFLMSQYRKAERFRLFLTFLIPLSVCLFLLNGSIGMTDAGAVFLIFLSGLTIPLSSGKEKRRIRSKRKRDHELFIPVPLGGRVCSAGEGSPAQTKGYWLLSASQAGLLILLFLLVGTADRHFSVSFPSPSVVEERPWTWESLAEASAAEALPGVREMLMHRAYQESFSYGGTWMMPRRDDTVNLKVFFLEEGRIVSSIKPVLIFDQAWLARFFEDMYQEGPGVLLRSEPYLPDISYTNLIAGIPAKGDLMLSGLLLLLGILLSLMNSAAIPAGRSEEFRMRNHLLLLRRKQQAA